MEAHCFHHEGHEEDLRNKECRTDTLGFFDPVRYFKRFPFFMTFVLFVVKYSFV